MGQYHIVVNRAKKEYLNPHALGDGVKAMEFGCSSDGTMSGLAMLLAIDNGKGGGDFTYQDAKGDRNDPDLAGRWAGDPIVIAGDYGDPEPELGPDKEGKPRNLHDAAQADYKDISHQVAKALKDCGAEVRKPWGSEIKEARTKNVRIPVSGILDACTIEETAAGFSIALPSDAGKLERNALERYLGSLAETARILEEAQTRTAAAGLDPEGHEARALAWSVAAAIAHLPIGTPAAAARLQVRCRAGSTLDAYL